jgi:hypothetical protein
LEALGRGRLPAGSPAPRKDVRMSSKHRPTTQKNRRRSQAAALASLALGAVALIGASGPAMAAKGSGHTSGGTGSISLVLLNSSDNLAHYGGQVTFDVSTTATDKPSVKLTCYQGGVSVYRASAGFYPDYPWKWAQTFTLASSVWTGGAADCTADLYYVNSKGAFTTLTTLSFPVYA